MWIVILLSIIKPMMMKNEDFEPFFYYNELNKAYYFVYEVGSCRQFLKEIKPYIDELCDQSSNVYKCIHAMLRNSYESSQPPGPLLIMRYLSLYQESFQKMIGRIEKIIFTPIDVEINLVTVERESFAQSFTYQFDIDLNFSWTDNRICTPFKENWSIDINLDIEDHFSKAIWHPKLFFNESAGHLSQSFLETVQRFTIESRVKLFDSNSSLNNTGYFLQSWDNNSYIVRSPKVTMYQKVRLDVSCDPDAKFFPFESFACEIELLSQEEQACVKWFKSPKLGSDFKLYGFEASVDQVGVYRREGYQNLSLSAIKFTVRFKRTVGMAWRIWVLNLVSLVVAFGSFLITQIIKPIASFSHFLFGVISTLLIYLKYSQVESNYLFSFFTYWFIGIVLFLISSLALFTISQIIPNLLPKKYSQEVKLRITRELLRNETRKSFFELIKSVILVIFLVIFFMSLCFLFFQSEFILDIDLFKTTSNFNSNVTKTSKISNKAQPHCFLTHYYVKDEYPIRFLRQSPSLVDEDIVLKYFIKTNLKFISKPIQKFSHFQTSGQNCKSLEESFHDVIWNEINNFSCVKEEDIVISFTTPKAKQKNITTSTTSKSQIVTTKMTPRTTKKRPITIITTKKITTPKNYEIFTTTSAPKMKKIPATMKLPQPLEYFRQELLDIRQRIRELSEFHQALGIHFLIAKNISL